MTNPCQAAALASRDSLDKSPSPAPVSPCHDVITMLSNQTKARACLHISAPPTLGTHTGGTTMRHNMGPVDSKWVKHP